MPHSLSALLTPTRAPHARLLKHWEGRIVSLLALVRYPHTQSLASSLARSHPLWLACPLLLSRACPLLVHSCFLSGPLAWFLLASLLLHASSLAFFLLFERISNSFSICGPSRRAQSPPKLTPPHLRTITMTTRALKKGRVQRSRNKYGHKRC